MGDPIGQLAKSINSIDIESILKEAYSQANIQKYVKETVTERLYNKGITGSGNKLRTDGAKRDGNPAYSNFTERMIRGKKLDNVTLFDTGDLHNSFRSFLVSNGWVQQMNFENSRYFEDSPKGIFANFQTSYSTAEEFYNDVESLTPEELDKVSLMMFLIVEKRLNEIIQK